MSDQAASALTNIPAGMLIWLCLGAGAAITVLLVGLVAVIRWLLGPVMDTGDGQGGVPGRGHLRRVTGHVDRERLPVTRALSVAEQDAIHGPGLGDVVSQDRIHTEQWRAAWGEVADALTPRMVAPTRADLTALNATEVIPRDFGGLGDLDPDPGLGGGR